MKTKTKEKIKNGLLMAVVFVAMQALMLWVFMTWLESPAEQPITQTEWMQELTE